MKILFDHNVDRRLRRHLTDHEVKTTRDMRWENLKNGLLIRAAADNGFDVLLSVDKNIEREHNLAKLPLPVVIVDSFSNALPELLPFVPPIMALFSQKLAPALYVILKDGNVLRLTAPR